MGLATVELVMAFEEEFGIKISDADAERMQSVGGVVSYVFEEQQRRGVQDADVQKIFERVKAITVEQLGVNPDQIFLWTTFIEDLGAG